MLAEPKYFMSQAFTERVGKLSLASDILWVLGMWVGLGTTLLAAFEHFKPTSGEFLVYASLLVRSTLYLWAGDARRERGGEVLSLLFQVGLVAGLFELLVDWVLVHGVSSGRLVYAPTHDLILLASPLWMPVAWACVITELGYPALRLFGFLRKKMAVGGAALCTSLLIGISAGIMVGFYEYFADLAGWWKYEPARAMIGSACALYIPLGEAFMFFFILPVAARVMARSDRPLAAKIEGGALFALAIAGGYGAAYALLEMRFF